MFNFSNPSVRRWVKKSDEGALTTHNPTTDSTEVVVEQPTATYRGVVGKTMLLIALTLLSAVAIMFATRYTIFAIADGAEITEGAVTGFLIAVGVAVVLMIVCSIGIAVSPKLAKVFGPIYAIIQGAFLGIVAAFIDMIFPFVTVAAVLGTLIVFVVCLLTYRLIGVRIKSNFMRVLTISLMCFVLVEIIIVPIMLFANIGDGFMVLLVAQAIVSFICIIFASITIVYDLQNIDRVVQGNADKVYEWPVAFSLVTSLIYLYMQILQLLLRIIALFSSKKK